MTFDYESNTTVLNSKLSQKEGDWSRVELYFRHRLFKINLEKLPFCIGRDDESDLQVFSDVASRQHCRIEIVNGQIGIKDTSTNGTFIQFGRADEILIKDDFCPLTGQGRICLGRQLQDQDPNIILFKVVREEKVAET